MIIFGQSGRFCNFDVKERHRSIVQTAKDVLFRLYCHSLNALEVTR